MGHILVVEDDDILREEVVTWLTFEGHAATPAANGQEALDAVSAAAFDLVISDVMMPDMDGLRLLSELRTRIETQLLPVILLTARAERSDIRLGMQLGADDYITKPFSRGELLQAVAARLERQAQHRREVDESVAAMQRVLHYSLPHELRTPLSAILMSAELLTDDGAMAPEKRDKIARLILQSSKRLQRLIENYLLYAQLELVRSDAALTAALRSEQMREAGTLVQQIAGTVAAQHLRPDDLQLAIDVCDPLLALRGDDWRKIVYELVDNAFKFSVSGTPVLVRAGCEDGLYVLSVCDRGRGMTSAQTKQIGAYKQFDRRVYEQQGLGLGLAIACNLVDLHGGRLLVESTQGEGTCVQVHLTPTMFAARDPAAA